MDPEGFLVTHPGLVLGLLVALVIAYIGLSIWVPFARKRWRPVDGTLFDALLDLAEAFLVYSPKFFSALSKLRGKYSPVLTVVAEVVSELQTTRVTVEVQTPPSVPVDPDPHVVSIPVGPDSEETTWPGSNGASTRVDVSTLLPPAPPPPSGGKS